MKSGISSLVWLRRDLRLRDNPALSFSAHLPGRTVALYFIEPEQKTASSQWVQSSLRRLSSSLSAYGIPLHIQQGDPIHAIRSTIATFKPKTLVWNRSSNPSEKSLEETIYNTFHSTIDIHTFHNGFLLDFDQFKTKNGSLFQVFTPFWKTARSLLGKMEEAPHIKQISSASNKENSLLNDEETPGEDEAWKKWKHFVRHGLATYSARRDLLFQAGTSRLSSHLHFGEISIRCLVNDLLAIEDPCLQQGKEAFLRQLIWREFAAYLLSHHPSMETRSLKDTLSPSAWRHNNHELSAWKAGKTGIPLVDAAMRELLKTGWMHNRGRLIVASFLTKHLLHQWQEGAEWFMERLYDADQANNSFGWQWVAGSGADSAPYFRIFNPVLQGRRFDKEGEYIRRYVPELSLLPERYIHAPWEAPPSLLKECHVDLGNNYPYPIVDLEEGRKRALQAFYTSLKK